MPRFFVYCQLGLSAVGPGHKGLFVKSSLESQKLYPNKVVCSVRSSLAYLSFKKGKLRLYFLQSLSDFQPI